MVSDYAALFQTCLARSLELSLDRISQDDGPLDFADLNQALHSLSYAFSEDAHWSAARALVLALAPKMERHGWREELKAVLDAALDRSVDLGDPEAEAELRWHMGVLLHLLGRYGEAQTHLEASVRLAERLGMHRNRARALARLASVARWQRRLDEAERLVVTAGALLDEGDPEQAYLLSVQGQAALDRQLWTQAARCFEQALSRAAASQDQRLTAWLWVNLGMAKWKLDRMQDAICCYQEAIRIFSVVEDPVHQAVAQMDLGIMYALSNDPLAALAQYALAEPVFRQTADINRQAMLYNNIGYVHHELLRQWPEAEHFYKLSIERATEIGNRYEKCNALDNLGLAYAAQGRHQEAEAVFAEAFHELTKIDPDPSYQHLLDEVTTHREQARQRSQEADTTRGDDRPEPVEE